MQTQESKKIDKMVEQRNAEARKHFKKNQALSESLIKLDTAFGINSNPICNQLQIVGEKYVVFMVGSIIVVRDFAQKSQNFYSYPNRFNNVTALYVVSKEQKFKEKMKKLDKEGKPQYVLGAVPVKIYLAESSENQ